jgi:hypothetical protein
VEIGSASGCGSPSAGDRSGGSWIGIWHGLGFGGREDRREVVAAAVGEGDGLGFLCRER